MEQVETLFILSQLQAEGNLTNHLVEQDLINHTNEDDIVLLL